MLQGKLCRFSLFVLILLATIAIACYCSKESFGASTTAQTAGTGIMWTSAAITSASQTGTIPTIVSVTNGLLYQLQGNFYTNSLNGVNISLSNCTLYSDAGGTTAVSGNKILVAFGLVPPTNPSAYTTSYWFTPSGTGNITFSVDYALPAGNTTGLLNNQFTISITQLVIKQSVTGSTTYLTNNSTQGADFAAGTSTQYIGKAMKAIPLIGFISSTTTAIGSGYKNMIPYGDGPNSAFFRNVPTTFSSQDDFINLITNMTLPPNLPPVPSNIDLYIGIWTDVGFTIDAVPPGSTVTLSGPTSGIGTLSNPYARTAPRAPNCQQTFKLILP